MVECGQLFEGFEEVAVDGFRDQLGFGGWARDFLDCTETEQAVGGLNSWAARVASGGRRPWLGELPPHPGQEGVDEVGAADVEGTVRGASVTAFRGGRGGLLPGVGTCKLA